MLTLPNEEPRTQEEFEETLFEESHGLDAEPYRKIQILGEIAIFQQQRFQKYENALLGWPSRD